MAMAHLVYLLTNDLKFKGLNIGAAVIKKKCRETTKYNHILKSDLAQLIEKLAHDPNFEGLIRATPGIGENCGNKKVPPHIDNSSSTVDRTIG
jgi:hypothetical protein